MIMRVPDAEEMTELTIRATDLARNFQHDYVGVEHFVLAMKTMPDSLSIAILRATRIDLDAFWIQLEQAARVVTGRPVPSRLPLTPRCQTIRRLAQKFAKYEKAKTVHCHHFLFAVAKEQHSLPATLLAKMHTEAVADYSGSDMLASQLLSFLRFDDPGFIGPK